MVALTPAGIQCRGAGAAGIAGLSRAGKESSMQRDSSEACNLPPGKGKLVGKGQGTELHW